MVQELKIIPANVTNEVPTAVWIATLIKTYENFVIKSKNDYWINQRDIQAIASKLCTKNIDNARISQWCNADHPNNTYNYLRAKDKLRRLTKVGEFENTKEYPKELKLQEFISVNSDIKLVDLVTWYKEY
jgi:hypothetical protein